MQRDDLWLWCDLEMTGLDLYKDTIIEIATIITDIDLNVIAIGPNIAIKTQENILQSMDAWNMKTHTNSGLLDKVRLSNTNMADACNQTLEFISTHIKPNSSPLCGNSIFQDKMFLHKYMPEVLKYLHYRTIDVSSIKILTLNWYPELQVFAKNNNHTAYADILESIKELQHYRKAVFKHIKP